MKKALLALMVAGLLAVPVATFTACDGDNVSGKDVTVLEAEYTDLTGVVGAGLSSSATELQLIHGSGSQADIDRGWSNGYMIGETYNTAFKLTFNFNADKAGEATLILRLSCEFAGGMTLDSNGFGIKVNGEEVQYSNLFIAYGNALDQAKFYDKTIPSKIALKEGANVIELSVKDNTYNSGAIGGPSIDCIKLKTESKITWTPKTENIENR